MCTTSLGDRGVPLRVIDDVIAARVDASRSRAAGRR
jgi:hypothetical protein